jgi:hypothetical protein
MCAVSTSTALGGLVDLDVLNNEVAGVEAFGVCISLGILQEAEEMLGRLHRPAGFGNTPLLACTPA